MVARWIWWAIAVVAILIIGWIVVAAVSDNDEGEIGRDNQGTAQNQNEQEEDILSRIVDNPSEFYGQQVTIDGEVQDVFSTRVFKVSNEVVGDELLIITRNPLSQEQAVQAEEFLADNANVRAIGTVRQLTVVEVEREFGIDLDPQVEAEFESKPVLIASRVVFTDQDDLLWEFDDSREEVLPDTGG